MSVEQVVFLAWLGGYLGMIVPTARAVLRLLGDGGRVDPEERALAAFLGLVAWSNGLGPTHRYLVPFEELPVAVQAQDEVGRAAIVAVARARMRVEFHEPGR